MKRERVCVGSTAARKRVCFCNCQQRKECYLKWRLCGRKWWVCVAASVTWRLYLMFNTYLAMHHKEHLPKSINKLPKYVQILLIRLVKVQSGNISQIVVTLVAATTMNICQKHKQIAKVCWKLCYLKIDLQTIANDIIFCESGNISPFLVTLVAATTGASNQKKFRLWKKKLSMAALRMKKEKTK